MDLTSEGFDDELDVFSRDSLYGFLHNMISILVFDAFENIDLKLTDKLCLLICKDMFQSLEWS